MPRLAERHGLQSVTVDCRAVHVADVILSVGVRGCRDQNERDKAEHESENERPYSSGLHRSLHRFCVPRRRNRQHAASFPRKGRRQGGGRQDCRTNGAAREPLGLQSSFMIVPSMPAIMAVGALPDYLLVDRTASHLFGLGDLCFSERRACDHQAAIGTSISNRVSFIISPSRKRNRALWANFNADLTSNYQPIKIRNCPPHFFSTLLNGLAGLKFCVARHLNVSLCFWIVQDG